MTQQAEVWYFKSESQGLVIDEKTGRTIAVTYDPKDAPLVAAAPLLLAAAEMLLKKMNRGSNDFAGWHAQSAVDIGEILNEFRYAINEAKPQ